MNQYDYINNSNFEDKIYINNNNQITEEINQSISIKLSELEQDIFNLINFIRTNPIDYCNNLIHKNTNKKRQEISQIIQYLEDVHKKEILLPYKIVPEISSAARNLLNNLSHHYKINRNLNLKELDPSCLNLKTRLSNYGERTGRIFETVLIKMNNPEDIINHILMEEKGRNMLLSYKMKYIGIACALFPSNLLCSVIDIVQDFVPFKIKNTLSTNYLNSTNTKNNDNTSFFQKSFDNNSYIRSSKKFKTNSETVSLIDNLNYKNSKDNLKLNIVMPKLIQNDEKNNIETNKNFNDKNSLENKNESCDNNKQNNNLGKNEPYKSPKKLYQLQNTKKNIVQISPISESYNVIIKKTTIPKRNNSNNINIIKKDQNSKNNNNNNSENIDKIKFTITGISNNHQREIEEISKKNLNKSNSVCSFNLSSHNFKSNNKNKFQRLNFEEKMEILHKINQRNNKTPNSNSPRSKNLGNPPSLTPNGNIPDYFSQNNSRKSPYRSTYNPDNLDIYSENEKINIYNNNIIKNNNNNADGGSQTFIDLQSNKGIENNEEYSRKKINEIKNDLLYFKNQLKNELRKEVREEVREEIKNEFNKKLLYQNQRQPIIINIDRDYDNQIKKSFKNYYDDRDKRNSYDGNNEINDKIFYHPNKSNSSYYFNKNKGKNRWSSVQKYYYIKNNNNNINNINNTNIFFPDNESQFSQNSVYYPKERKSLDFKDLLNNNKSSNGISLKEKYKEKYEQLNNIKNSTNDSNKDNINSQDIIVGDSYKNIKKDSNDTGDKNIDHSYFNGGNKPRNRKEIKKLIKLYNMVKDDQRNKTIIDNNNININDYNCNNNKSFTNVYLINNNNSKDNANDNNEKYNTSEKFDQNDNLNRSNEIKSNSKINYNINHYKEKSNINEGNKIFNYEKFESKDLLDYSEIMSKQRNKSVRNINNINNKKYINEINININTNKSEDFVNLKNNISDNGNKKEEIGNNNNGKECILEKNIYNKNNDSYNSKKNNDNVNNDINININNKDKNDKLSLTGRFIEETSNLKNGEKNNIFKSQEKLFIQNDRNKNIINEFKKEKPNISKSVKFEENRIINSVKTNKREIDFKNEKEKSDEYLEKRKVQKLHSDLIKEYQNLDRIDNSFYYNLNIKSNDSKSNDESNRYNLYSNMIKTKKIKLGGRKDYEQNLYKNNDYLEIERKKIKFPRNIQKGFQYENNLLNNYQNVSPRFNKNLTAKAISYYKKKKFVPYTYHPKEYKINYNNYVKKKEKGDKNKNESLEKKYIKDPEGNIIETYVKKTKYNDGSVLLEYV